MSPRKRTAKEAVKKAFPTAESRPPNPRGFYYNQWNIIVPPTSSGIFGPMTRILGHGETAKAAWADALRHIAQGGGK